MSPRVKEVIKAYDAGGIMEVKGYFNQDQMVIDPSTWSNEINNLINDNNLVYACAQIEVVSEKFKI